MISKLYASLYIIDADQFPFWLFCCKRDEVGRADSEEKDKQDTNYKAYKIRENSTLASKKKINARGGAKTNSIVIVTLALASPPIESNFTRAFRQMQQRCKGGRYCYRYLSLCLFPGTPRASASTLGALLIEFLMNVWSLPVLFLFPQGPFSSPA